MSDNPYQTPPQTEQATSNKTWAVAVVLVAIIIAAGVIGYRNFQLRNRMQAAAARTALRRAVNGLAPPTEEMSKPTESTPPNAAIP